MYYTREEIKKLAAGIAEQYGVPPALIKKLIEVESGWQIYAVRYEPRFTKFIAPGPDVLKTTWETERVMQSISWGLCQIMGYTARVRGWTSPIPELLEPMRNIDFACRYLSELHQHHPEAPSWRWAVTAYNHGEQWESIEPRWWRDGYTARYHEILSELGEA